MQLTHGFSPPNLTRIAHLFVLVVAVWLLILGLFNVRHPSDWAMGDWLINYAGGFVRRGLAGQLALALQHLRVPLLWSVLALQWLLYGIVLAFVWRLASRQPWNWWRAALFFSPATLAFVLLDPPFAYRKDIVFFALLSLLLLTGRHMPETQSAGWLRRSLKITVGCAICVLAHEGLIVYFPYLFAAQALVSRSVRDTVRVLLVPALVSGGLFLLVSHFPGNQQVAKAVCHSIGGTLTEPPSGLCGGAINYLAHDSAYAHREVVRVLLGSHAWLAWPFLFVLPLVPVVLGLVQFWQQDRQAAKILLGATLTAFVLSFSVFYYGTDWTRWIYLHLFSLMLLMLYASRQHLAWSAKETSQLFTGPASRRWGAIVLLVLYCLGWELTTYRQRPLYGSFVRFIAQNIAHGRQ